MLRLIHRQQTSAQRRIAARLDELQSAAASWRRHDLKRAPRCQCFPDMLAVCRAAQRPNPRSGLRHPLVESTCPTLAARARAVALAQLLDRARAGVRARPSNVDLSGRSSVARTLSSRSLVARTLSSRSARLADAVSSASRSTRVPSCRGWWCRARLPTLGRPSPTAQTRNGSRRAWPRAPWMPSSRKTPSLTSGSHSDRRTSSASSASARRSRPRPGAHDLSIASRR